MIASMVRATGILLIVAGRLYGATAASEAMRCIHGRSPDVEIRHCTAAIEVGGLPDAGLAVVLGRRCVAYGEKHDYARALPDCERAVHLAPNSALHVYCRGRVRYYSGNLDGAMLDAEQAIRLDPNYALAYSGRAFISKKRGDYDQAIQDYGEALRLRPDGATYYGRGWCYLHKGDYGLAKPDFDEAIRRGLGADAYYSRGLCYIHEVDYSRAIADLDQAIRLKRNYAWSYSSRALLFSRRGEYDLAIRDYTQAVRLAPDAENYEARGRAYFHKGAYDLALWDFARAWWHIWVPLALLAGLIYIVGRRKPKRAQAPTGDGDDSPDGDDLEPLVASPDAPAEDPVPDPEPLQSDTDLDVLIRTGVRNPAAIGLAQGLLQEAGVPFFVMERTEPTSQASGNFGWWDIRVPHEREAEAREIIQAVEEMK